jgi:hypothetical protein
MYGTASLIRPILPCSLAFWSRNNSVQPGAGKLAPGLFKKDPLHMIPDKIPAGMLKEFAYCPRLCWLEWQDSEYSETRDTLDGWFIHRRVDQPDNADIPPPDRTSEAAKKK